VLSTPAAPKAFLPEFKSATSVQAEPFQDSVKAVVGGDSPPNLIADD